MRSLLLICLVSFMCAVEQPTASTLPAEAQKVLAALDIQLTDLQHKAVKDLRKVAIELGKQGNLDDALAVKKVADELEAAAKTSKLDKPVEPNNAGLSAFDGRWLPGGNEGDAYEFKNGEYHCLAGSGLHQPQWLSGKLVLINATTLAFNGVNGFSVEFHVVDHDSLLESGRKLWTRVKAPKP